MPQYSGIKDVRRDDPNNLANLAFVADLMLAQTIRSQVPPTDDNAFSAQFPRLSVRFSEISIETLNFQQISEKMKTAAPEDCDILSRALTMIQEAEERPIVRGKPQIPPSELRIAG